MASFDPQLSEDGMLKLNDVAIEKIIDLDPFSFPLTTLLS